ncbi:MAG TPA: ATP-binding protein [Burkholderiales bacterium]|nr:ATP-binding protein [Burkholderiales bacterium]
MAGQPAPVGKGLSRLPGLGALRARLRERPDTEHEQAFVRLLNSLIFGAYLIPQDAAHWLIYFIYLFATAGIIVAVVADRQVSPLRRILGAAADAAMVTYTLMEFGEAGAPLYLIYLWITLANGFRYGTRYLVATLAFCLAGFGTALVFSEFWIEHRVLGLGLFVGLIALSLYVRRLVTQLFDALARAESANQAKRRFISVVSHELRTPLNAIIGMADLLRDTSLNREQADMLQTLRGSSRIMLGLVEDVLDFSKIEAGKLSVERADFDLHALINSTCRILGAQAAARGIDVVVSIMPDVPPALSGDAHHVRQVLINLIGNAVKFTERGSVTVHVSAQSETAARVRLKFSIRDTGIGIAPEAQAHIFDSFTQADQSTTRRFGGTGLGTTIAKQLVELMGGRIGLESAVGLGTTFWFEIEFDKQPEQAGGVGDLAGARVLLVGFPDAERAPLEGALAGWGALPVAAATLEEAASRLVAEISLAQPYHSALFYCADRDTGMAARFRRAAPDPAPPCVLAVARDAALPRFEALAAGFAAVLELPYEKRQLFNVLHSIAAGADEGRERVIRLGDYARRGAAAKKARVLVADDNATNRQVIGKILERGGHEATLVGDGEQALERLDAERYDVVILDRNMPRMGGLEVLQALRMMTRGAERIPVLIFSADVTPEARQAALDAGADGFLPKPIEARRLLDEVAAAAGRQAGAQAPQPLAAPREKPAAELPVVNTDTLAHLRELSNSPGFVKKLCGVFVADSKALIERIEAAAAARNYGELRSHLHAMKGSSASLGAERLARLCTEIGAGADSELRLRGPQLVRQLTQELSAVSEALERYLQQRQQAT